MSRTKTRRNEQQDDAVSIAGRNPPHDLKAEAAVLSAVMLEPADVLEDVIDVLGDTVDEFDQRQKHPKFYSLPNGWIMASICELRAQKRPIDLISVQAWLNDRGLLDAAGGNGYLAEIIDATPAIAHARDHAMIVYNKWRQRAHIANCQRSAAHAYEDADIAGLLDTHIEKTNALATANASIAMTALGDGLVASLERDYELVQNGIGLMGTRTMLAELDSKIAGLHDGDLYIVAARPGMGKTAFAMGIAMNIAMQSNRAELFQTPVELGCPIFSLEMPKAQLNTRIVCTDASVDLGRYRKGELDIVEWGRMFDSAKALSPLPVWIDDTAAITVSEIRAKVRRLQSSWCRPFSKTVDASGRVTVHPERKIGAVFIDYLQLVRDDQKSQSREEAVANISKNLKVMAKELKLPIVALSQLNRSVETRGKDKRPMLSDLRESGAIEQDADAIMFLYRDEYYNPGKPENANVAEVIIAKQRNGPTGKVLVRFESRCTKFSNLDFNDKQTYVASNGGDE